VDRFGRAEQQHHPAQGIFDQAECNPDEGDHVLIVPQRLVLGLPRDAAPRRTAFLRRTAYDDHRRQACDPGRAANLGMKALAPSLTSTRPRFAGFPLREGSRRGAVESRVEPGVEPVPRISASAMLIQVAWAGW
jgi:hypothetical protein